MIKITIVLKNEIATKLKDLLPENFAGNIEYSLRYNPKTVEVDITNYDLQTLRKVKDFLSENKLRTSTIIVNNFIEIKEGDSEVPIKNINIFASVLSEAVQELPNRILFKKDSETNEFLPYLIKKVEFVKGRVYRDAIEPDRCTIYTSYNGISGYKENTINFFNEDCGKYKSYRNYKSILASKDIILENEELMENFNEAEAKYIDEKKNYNKQYIGNGVMFPENRFRRNEIFTFVNHKFVNDEEINDNKYKGTDVCYDVDGDNIFHVPYHPYLYVYDLSTYENGFVHVNQLADYVYDDSLREKLILPDFHKDLIDILTNDLSILSGDIIEGKSTGTTILCKGVPGTGKTLTAEVYAELIHKPLFKINAGVLGLSFADVEKNLEKILKRSERWGSVLLIDEADTYIRKRGDDNAQNAVVAAFLRTLEYFNGLLFLTTNRLDDVDDAIESRCIARIMYEKPNKENAMSIWKVLSKEFELDLKEETIARLVDIFPEISGRDIKELLRLTARYCNGKGYDINNIEHFISCAQFRDLIPAV